MAEKICCPGPLGTSGGNTASGGAFREAVCVHTSKVYDSCRSKECLRDIRVYLTRDAQDMLDSGGIVSVKPRTADLLCVKIDVEPVQFNRGLYSVDSRFFYRIECEVSCAVGRPRIVDGLAVIDKRVMLFGGEGGARIFSSHYIEDGTDVQLRPNSNRPTAVIEVVDPVMLDARVVAPETKCNCCCCALHEVPKQLCSCFDGDDLVLANDGYQLFVTLGQFSIIRLERDIQLLMPAYDICLPRRDCSNSNIGGETDPCEVFSNFDFPIDAFFPPRGERADCLFTGANGVNGANANSGCGCRANAANGCNK